MSFTPKAAHCQRAAGPSSPSSTKRPRASGRCASHGGGGRTGHVRPHRSTLLSPGRVGMATILYVGTAGSDDPTRAGLPFNFALGAIEAGHHPQIFLAGEAAYLMKDAVPAAVMPVAMPPLREMLDAVVAKRVPIFV